MKLKINPFSLWLAYDITKPSLIQGMLPTFLTLTSVPLYADDKRIVPKLLFNVYNINSFWMKGTRVEIQTVALHKKKKTYHFVVLDCYTDTQQWTPLNGISAPNAVCNFKSKNNFYYFDLEADEKKLEIHGNILPLSTKISKQFAVDCNRACYFRDCDTAFKMSFDEAEIMRPVRRLSQTKISNTLWVPYRNKIVSHVFIHPKKMIFDVDVPGMWYDVV